MLTLVAISDPIWAAPKHYSRPQRFYLSFLRDERDLPFLTLTVRITLTMLPIAVLLYLPFIQGWLWWSLAVVYQWLNHIVYKGPFGLMLHCTSHRPLFRRESGFLNLYLPWVLSPFFGHSPDTYFTHHIGMHHAENNLWEDESSTMPYQRDSPHDFLRYFGSFLLTGIYRLAAYFSRKGRKKLLHRAVRGEILFFLWCIAWSFVSLKATVCVFIIPFLIYRLIAMMGNWAQHAFIDPADPANPYKNSVTCINTPYNHKCWNDGYHISHHERQTMHWTEHPAYFRKTLDRYIAEDAIVFDGIHFLHVFIYLMRKRYDLLAARFVNLGNRYPDEEAVMAMLRYRTQRIGRPEAVRRNLSAMPVATS